MEKSIPKKQLNLIFNKEDCNVNNESFENDKILFKSYCEKTNSTFYVDVDKMNKDSEITVICGKCDKHILATLADFFKFGCTKCNKFKRTYEYVKETVEKTGDTLISTEYKNGYTPIEILCRKCKQEYKIRHDSVLHGQGCQRCGGCLKLTYDFVKEEINKRGNFTLVSITYKNAITPLEILCHKCNKIYKAEYRSFRRGDGCKFCFVGRKKTYDEVLAYVESNGDKLLSKEYVGTHSKLLIECGKCHNTHSVSHQDYKSSEHGACLTCSRESIKNKLRLGYEYVSRYISDVGDKLISTTYFKTIDKLDIQCQYCERIFAISFASYADGARCRYCSDVLSKAENLITSYLIERNIAFVPQKKFEDCKNIHTLPFDFYVDDRFLIEYNGEQHYYPVKYFGGEDKYATRIKIDKIKNDYCVKNEIPLLLIPYWEFNNITSLIDQFLDYNYSYKPDQINPNKIIDKPVKQLIFKKRIPSSDEPIKPLIFKKRISSSEEPIKQLIFKKRISSSQEPIKQLIFKKRIPSSQELIKQIIFKQRLPTIQ